MNDMPNLLKKSVAASLLISLGVCGLLVTDYSILSIILFAFGLLTICKLNYNLFTGKCGYVIENNNLVDVLQILVFNFIAASLIGFLFAFMDPKLMTVALSKVETWTWSFSFFIKSFMCGVIMYLAVEIYRRGSSLGIIFGIPLFIMCGFQHSIANIVIMGCSFEFNSAIVLCIIGNWAGSLFAWWLTKITADKGVVE